jgi:hypothetical protein
VAKELSCELTRFSLGIKRSSSGNCYTDGKTALPAGTNPYSRKMPLPAGKRLYGRFADQTGRVSVLTALLVSQCRRLRAYRSTGGIMTPEPRA